MSLLASPSVDTPVSIPPRGLKVHNLVFSQDSGNEYSEFRVQCEIRIPNTKEGRADGDKILKALAQPTLEALNDVEERLRKYIHPLATKSFMATIENGFEDFISAYLKAPK